MNGNELALRPFRHFADFSGRLARDELFYLGSLKAPTRYGEGPHHGPIGEPA